MHEIKHTVETCDDAFASPIFAQRVQERAEYQELVRKWNTLAIVLCVRGIDIKGYVVLYANDHKTRRAFVPMLGVRPKFQKQHCGKYLLEACEDFARWKGMETISLEVRKDNINAQGFYQHLGFKEESERDHSFIYTCCFAR